MDVEKRLSEIVKKYKIDLVAVKNEKGKVQFAFVDLDTDNIDIYGIKEENKYAH